MRRQNHLYHLLPLLEFIGNFSKSADFKAKLFDTGTREQAKRVPVSNNLATTL